MVEGASVAISIEDALDIGSPSLDAGLNWLRPSLHDQRQERQCCIGLEGKPLRAIAILGRVGTILSCSFNHLTVASGKVRDVTAANCGQMVQTIE